MKQLIFLTIALACLGLPPTARSVGSNLPVIELQTDQEIGPEKKIPCTVKMVAAEASKQEGTDALKGQIRVRGASSQAYDKKSFALKLDKAASWLGLRKNRDWVLNAAFVDCSMMRHKLAYDLFQSLSTDGAKRFASSSRFVEVNLNAKYHGAYLLMERVEGSLLGLGKYAADAKTHAVLYKAVDHGANFAQPGHGDYEQHQPDTETGEYWGPLEDLNQFVSQAPNKQFFDPKSGIASRLDIDNAIDFHLLVLLTSNMDGITKNYYLARHAPTPETPQPRFFFVPWDYDATFGRNYEGSPVAPTEWLSNHLFDRLLGDAGYRQKFAARWRQLRKAQFSAANIARMIDDNAQTLGDAAQRNERRWKGDADPGQLAFTEDLKQMKVWVTARVQWLDTEIARRTRR